MVSPVRKWSWHPMQAPVLTRHRTHLLVVVIELGQVTKHRGGPIPHLAASRGLQDWQLEEVVSLACCEALEEFFEGWLLAAFSKPGKDVARLSSRRAGALDNVSGVRSVGTSVGTLSVRTY